MLGQEQSGFAEDSTNMFLYKTISELLKHMILIYWVCHLMSESPNTLEIKSIPTEEVIEETDNRLG